jgi:hypothetical protein
LTIFELSKTLQEVFKTTKTTNFIQFSLRSAKDISKFGGQMIPLYLEKSYSLHYDEKRVITTRKLDYFESNPHISVDGYKLRRSIKDINSTKFSEISPTSNLTGQVKGESTKNLCFRQLMRALFNSTELFGFKLKNRQEVFEILHPLGCNKKLNYYSQQKGLVFIKNSIPKNDITLNIVSNIKKS